MRYFSVVFLFFILLQGVSAEVVDRVPELLSQQLILREPSQNWVTTRPTVLVQGQNAFLGKVFVNGVDVPLHSDGRFSYELSLPVVGKSSIYISFVLPDLRVYTLVRRVLYLAQPKGHDALTYNTEVLTTVFNSGVVGPKMMSQDLTETVTMTHLSEIMARLDYLSDESGVSDDSDELSASQSEDVLKPIVYLDGKPDWDMPITTFQFWSSIMDVLSIQPTASITEARFLDLTYDWQQAQIQPLVSAGVLPTSPYLYPDSVMSLESALNGLSGIELIKRRMVLLRDFDEGYSTDNVLYRDHEAAVAGYKDAQSALWSSQQQLTVGSPEDGAISLGDSAVFVGQIYPPRPFYINAFKIVPEMSGQYFQELPLFLGENIFEFKLQGELVQQSVFRLNGYPDLASHWFEMTAAKLRWLDYLPPGDTFLPNETITRLELAHILNRFFNLEDVIMPFDGGDEISDIAVRRVVGNNVLSLDEGKFFPHRTMSRMRAVAAVMDASKLGGKLFQEALNFKDVPSTHWGYPYLERAVHNDLIRRESAFHPDRAITKAELYAILSRLPSVQSSFKETWPSSIMGKL